MKALACPTIEAAVRVRHRLCHQLFVHDHHSFDIVKLSHPHSLVLYRSI